MTNKEVIITHYLSPKQAEKAMFHVIISHKGIWIRVILLLILLICSIIDSQENIKMTGLAFAIALLFVSFVIQNYKLINLMGKLVKQKPRYFHDVTYTFNNTFLKKEGLRFENTYNWDEIEKIKITKEFYLLFIDKIQTHTIDKAQLSASEKNDLEEIFSSKSKVR